MHRSSARNRSAHALCALVLAVACDSPAGSHTADGGVLPGDAAGALGDAPGQDAGRGGPEDASVHGQVFPCDMAAGAGWENITPPWETTTPPGGDGLRWLLAVTPDPVNPGVVYTHTSSYGGTADAQHVFWRSSDCGATWEQIATGENGEALQRGIQWQITVDPVTAAVYTHSFYGTGGLYRSTNGGVDWTEVSPTGAGVPHFVQSWAMDPADHRHLFLTFHDDCSRADGTAWGTTASGGEIHSCYAETFDGAETWQLIPGRTEHWSEGAGAMIFGSGALGLGIPFDGLYVSRDDGTSWDQPVAYAGCFPGSVAIGGTDYVGCFYNNPILSSTDGARWEPVPNTRPTDAMVVTGRYLYAAASDTSGQPLWRAPLTDLTAWEHVPTPPTTTGNWIKDHGPLSYDATHHVLYMSLLFSGLYRMQTE